MATSCLRELAEPAVFFAEVAKQRSKFVGAVAFRMSWKLFYYLKNIEREQGNFTVNKELFQKEIVLRFQFAYYI